MSVLTKVGAWTVFLPITEEGKAATEKALVGFEGVRYEPFAASTQVVEGTNYRVLCNVYVSGQESAPYLAMVSFFKPLGTHNRAQLSSIEKLTS